jgi:hypothetical protein
MITQSCDANIADRCLEFDERMSPVVWVGRAGLTGSTEIGIMTHSALVSVSLDIRLNTITRIAERSITIDSVMASLGNERSGQGCKIIERFVDRHESVAGVDKASIGDASSTEVPIWAVEALVTDTINVLITSITDSIVTSVTTWSEKNLGNEIKARILNSIFKCVLRVVTMLHTNVASNAKVKVGACSASDKVLLGEFLNARIASASGNGDL